ncbi:MAG: hypothetical protein JRN67_11630 [Nitrososphaerota archaeon]|nr:hypothetical protein [Nitrososphaerota archaeon]
MTCTLEYIVVKLGTQSWKSGYNRVDPVSDIDVAGRVDGRAELVAVEVDTDVEIDVEVTVFVEIEVDMEVDMEVETDVTVDVLPEAPIAAYAPTATTTIITTTMATTTVVLIAFLGLEEILFNIDARDPTLRKTVFIYSQNRI